MNLTLLNTILNETQTYTYDDIVKMIALIDKIFVQVGGRVYQQTIGIPICTNCVPLLNDSFFYSYQADFLDEPLKQKQKQSALYWRCFVTQ